MNLLVNRNYNYNVHAGIKKLQVGPGGGPLLYVLSFISNVRGCRDVTATDEEPICIDLEVVIYFSNLKTKNRNWNT